MYQNTFFSTKTKEEIYFMEIVNMENLQKENLNEEVGGAIACLVGCGSFCALGWAGGVMFMASVATIA